MLMAPVEARGLDVASADSESEAVVLHVLFPTLYPGSEQVVGGAVSLENLSAVKAAVSIRGLWLVPQPELGWGNFLDLSAALGRTFLSPPWRGWRVTATPGIRAGWRHSDQTQVKFSGDNTRNSWKFASWCSHLLGSPEPRANPSSTQDSVACSVSSYDAGRVSAELGASVRRGLGRGWFVDVSLQFGFGWSIGEVGSGNAAKSETFRETRIQIGVGSTVR